MSGYRPVFALAPVSPIADTWMPLLSPSGGLGYGFKLGDRCCVSPAVAGGRNSSAAPDKGLLLRHERSGSALTPPRTARLRSTRGESLPQGRA